MKKALLFVAAAATAAAAAAAAVPDVLEEVQQLIDRVLLPANKSFRPILELMNPQADGSDAFEIDAQDGEVLLRGSSGVALSSAFGWYLKYYCNSSVSSWGRERSLYQLENFPSDSRDLPLPVNGPERHVRAARWSYYQNVVAASYSMVWWDWERWQREIDWMAMSGINLPLAFTGQEAVLDTVYRDRYNISQAGRDAFFSGPAFLAWNRMANMRGFGGPLPVRWNEGQAALQKKILRAMRALGMAPVLAGFSGRVPQEFVERHPEASFLQEETWNDFEGAYGNDYVLSPTDPLFLEVGSEVTQTTVVMFGINEDYGMPNIYSMDTFNEMKPPSNESAYLSNASAAVYQAMVAGDSRGVWLMQGWLFLDLDFWGPDQIGAYLSSAAVPDDGLIVVDLAAEHYPLGTKQKKVWPKLLSANPPASKPIIWCALHNYGGRRDVYGNLTDIIATPVADFDSLRDPTFQAGSMMIGTGITPEAIEQNPVYYELMNEMTWRLADFLSEEPLPSLQLSLEESAPMLASPQFCLASWVQAYAQRRYGSLSPSAAGAAWRELIGGVYADPATVHATMEQVPNFLYIDADDKASSDRGSRSDIGPAWKRRAVPLGSANDHTLSLSNSWEGLLAQEETAGGGLSYDLTDVGRAVLCATFDMAVALFTAANDRCSLGAATAAAAAAAKEEEEVPQPATKNLSECLASLRAIGGAMLELIKDTDELFAADVNFLVGTWISDAMAWARMGEGSGGKQGGDGGGDDDANDEVLALYSLNAKNQITLWGPNGEITDYASKPWAGLVGDYYHARWELFVAEVMAAAATRTSFNKTAFRQASLVIGQEWYLDNSTHYATEASGADVASLGRKLRTKYSAGPEESYATEEDTTIDESSSAILIDLNCTGALPPGTLAWLCNAEPLCTMFTSSGILATKAAADSVAQENGTMLYYAT
jgi:alpha-N-acetylglucosaminidase